MGKNAWRWGLVMALWGFAAPHWREVPGVFVQRAVAQPSYDCDAQAQTGIIEAYADQASVVQGETIRFMVRTTQDVPAAVEVPFTIHRVGPTQEPSISGTVSALCQPVPSDAWQRGCNWPETLAFNVPQSWPSGLYVAHFGDGDESVSYVDFVVRSAAPSARIVLQVPVTTRQAYNNWGGGSLYGKPSNQGFVKGPEVSFDRPDAGTDDSVFLVKEFIHWAESSEDHEPYRMEYITSVDLHARPDLLAPHWLFVTVGHDEYWTRPMRDALDSFVRNGGNAAIFSGNTSWWQSRLEPSPQGEPNRTLVCWKGGADPVQDETTTAHWFDPRVDHPENRTFGLSYRHEGIEGGGAIGFPHETGDDDPYVVDDASSWVFDGTGLADGDAFSAEIVGYETDALLFDPATNRPTGEDGSPNNFQILAKADLRSWGPETGWAILGLFDYGGTVFNVGTVEWAAALTDLPLARGSSKEEAADPTIKRITANVLDRLSLPKSPLQRATMSVHEYYAPTADGGLKFHFSTNPFVERGWEYNERAFFAFSSAVADSVPVWEYYVEEYDGGMRFHYSTDSGVTSGWMRNGVAFHAFDAPGPGRAPVYEYFFRQPSGGVRFYYSRDPNVTSGWTRNGVAFYVPTAGNLPTPPRYILPLPLPLPGPGHPLSVPRRSPLD